MTRSSVMRRFSRSVLSLEIPEDTSVTARGQSLFSRWLALRQQVQPVPVSSGNGQGDRGGVRRLFQPGPLCDQLP